LLRNKNVGYILHGAGEKIMQVVGRDSFIAELWELLEEKSIHLLGERRVGKTVVLQAMAEKPQGRVLAFYFELEAITTPNAFARLLYEKAAEHLPLAQHAA
jgi:predicted AAA+ superfamily ATPase